MIGCLTIPYFAAAVERRTDASLNRVPLILSQPPDLSDRVYAVSREAAACGVAPGARLRQAQTMCPQALFLTARPDEYQRTLTELLSLLTDFSPNVEPAADPLAALVYLDLAGLSAGDWIELAEQIGQTVQTQTRLDTALGLATGKFPAYLAAEAIGLNRVLYIAPGQERSFLAPLPVDYLPLEAELARRLQLLGLRTMQQFAALPAGAVLTQFGNRGRWLHRLAQGDDDRPVRAYPTQPVEQASQRFEGAVDNRQVLVAAARRLAEELATRLQEEGRAARVLQLTLQLEDDANESSSLTLRQPTDGAQRLSTNLINLIDRAELACGVTAMIVTLGDLEPVVVRQLDLFSQPNRLERELRLRTALPDLIARYGSDRFFEVAVTQPQAYLPEQRFELRAAQ